MAGSSNHSFDSTLPELRDGKSRREVNMTSITSRAAVARPIRPWLLDPTEQWPIERLMRYATIGFTARPTSRGSPPNRSPLAGPGQKVIVIAQAGTSLAE